MPLHEYLDPARTILVIRRLGGIGDILMTRPIFRAIKQKNPNVDVHYALPSNLIPLVQDCEAIDRIIPFEELDHNTIHSYRWYGDITRACIDHEIRFRSRVHIQRTNLWGNHLGIDVHDHNEQFRFTDEELSKARQAVRDQVGDSHSPLFFISPHSADPRRNLSKEHVETGIAWAQENGYQPVIVNGVKLPQYDTIPQIYGLSLRVWMALTTQASMALTTDTGALHLYGYLRIPTAAMFCFTSGKVVPRNYPTVVPFQLHRDNVEHAMACVPCYDWGACPFLRKDGNPVLKCVRDIPLDLVRQSLDQASQIALDPFYEAVEAIDDKVMNAMTFMQASFSSSVAHDRPAPAKPSVPSYLEINMAGADELDAFIACGISTAVRSKYPDTAIALVQVNSNIASILQLCPFASIDNSGSNNPNAAKLDIKTVSNYKHGWIKAMQDIIGVPTDGSAGLANCSSHVKQLMFDTYGSSNFELRDINGDPEMVVPDKVWVQPEWNWEQKLACAHLARRVVTDKVPMAFACASLGIPVRLEGTPMPIALKGSRIES